MKLGDNIIAASGLPPFFEADARPFPPPARRDHFPGGDAIRAAVRALSGFQKEALVTSARTGLTWRLVSDEGPYLNGHDAAPCPLAFLSVGMAAGYMNEITSLADQRGIALRQLRLVQDNYYTMKGSMQKRTMVGGAEPVELAVEIGCDADDATVGGLVHDAVQAAPLNGLLRGRHESLFKLAKNGMELSPANVAVLDVALLPDPKDGFDAAPKVGSLPLMQPVGTTPKKQVRAGTFTSGSSLADEQDRRLNIGAIATLRQDGIKDIRQMQYSPHGTSFRFLSCEDRRAPDAATLISAGIAFCFMTQFGRFVSMLELDLPAYRIVQDAHFSAGGASGRTWQPGRTDPVETHVFLETSETDTVAREMLDIAEQTCFLHALCRTDLKPKVKVMRL